MWITAAHNIYRSVWEMVTSRDFPGSSDGKAFACNEGTWVRSLAREDPLEKEMAIHSRTLAWKIPWMEEPGRLQSMGWQRVGHNWATSLTYVLYTDILCRSVVKSYPTLCNLMECGLPGFPVFHYLLEFAQAHVHWVSDATQPSHPLSFLSPPALSLSSIKVFSN